MAKLWREMGALLLDWKSDLSGAWRAILANVEPDLDAIPKDVTLEAGEVIFPGRKGKAHPEARADSHIFRALDGLAPDKVRAVILGQDPYTKVTQATGRSFEEGQLTEWSVIPKETSPSLRRIVQVLAQHRSGDAKYVDGDEAWPSLAEELKQGLQGIAPPQAFFDEWQSKGVLCLNAGLTFSRYDPDVQGAHIAMWRPVIQRILTALATRPNSPIVFLLWGGKAQSAFLDLEIMAAAQQAGTQDRVAVATHPHPNAKKTSDGKLPFLQAPNPFDSANNALKAAGGSNIMW